MNCEIPQTQIMHTKALGRTVRNTGARAGSMATKVAKGTFNSMRNAPTSSAKVLGKGMSAAGSAKDRIVQGKEALKNMDQSIKTHGTYIITLLSHFFNQH